ncbi:hypothetical protein Nepgr_032763 [Nepenthes gracilis]|uniref:Uncharacterized protein n=1 Tax=Nepenthes gracilis TaxID=150966 RepID=A0AAD3TJ91_NEPGR|nr:hypothetical protein Nepgr_032763 [Nepenthes gracilis]
MSLLSSSTIPIVSGSVFPALPVPRPTPIDSYLRLASDPLCPHLLDCCGDPSAPSIHSLGFSGSIQDSAQVICPLPVSDAINSEVYLSEPAVLASFSGVHQLGICPVVTESDLSNN